MSSLCIGTLAHVDAGKTSLTERLLYTAGVIDQIGSVDDGTTQTDTLDLERRRGLTIKSAVVSFAVDDVTVNLIDTPGHPDFIAEVERVLCVLDGVVLVISAVEGVQAQTRILMRTLQRLRIPTLIFVNKIDRGGARYERTLESLRDKLTPAIIPMGSVCEMGTKDAGFAPYATADARFMSRMAEVLAENDETILEAYIAGETSLGSRRLGKALVAQTRQALVYPVFFGSAITGAGVGSLAAGITRLLPRASGDTSGPVSGAVFKVERGGAGEKIAYARMFSGSVQVRDRLRFGRQKEQKVTGINVFDRGSVTRNGSLAAGQIGKLWGLGDVQIGDIIGESEMVVNGHHFAPPTLETVIVPRHAAGKGALHVALAQLAEQDPLINLRQDDIRQETYVSLYGEVQKEVIQETLAREFDVEVVFRETTTICIERPAGAGVAMEIIGKRPNPFQATVGLRISPEAVNSGVEFRLEVELGSIPLSFHKAVEETVRETLSQGLCGWQVTDCSVTMTHSGYSSATSTAGDFRNLTPLVLMSALVEATTMVYEPMHRFQIEMPAECYGPLLPALARLQAVPRAPVIAGQSCTLEGDIPAAKVHELRQNLPGLTRGEGAVECAFDHYRAVRGDTPTRPRLDHNPLNRKEYLLHVVRRV
jgi:ribosomal protection tetracycline resistance protein